VPPRRSIPARPRQIAVLLAVALVLGACGVRLGNRNTAARRPRPRVVVGPNPGPSTTLAPATTTTEPPPEDVKIIGDDGSATNTTVANAIGDLETWWATVFPKLYPEPYTPVKGGFYAIDHDTSPQGLPCSPSDISKVLENAYYCPADDAMVWDQQNLMPDLARNYGSFTAAIVLAHEWGHAIQARAKFIQPTIILEQQADCFAGAWVRHVRDDKTSRFRITIDDLDNALAGFLSLRDSPGTTVNDPNAHGSGFDRIRAFQDGFEDSATRCAQYRAGDPKPYLFAFDRAEVNTGGNLPLGNGKPGDDGIETQAFASLHAYWTKEYPEISGGERWNPLGRPIGFDPSHPPTCDGKKVFDYRLFVCIPDRYVGYDRVQKIPSVYEKSGDFAVAALFATQYGLDVEQQLGRPPRNEVTATLQADCYAGSWAASILPTGLPDPNVIITLSPGDLDEAVGVLLSSRSGGDRQRRGPGFDRVRAFGIGVVDGAEACAKVKPS
jgi:predicted metalloprotease